MPRKRKSKRRLVKKSGKRKTKKPSKKKKNKRKATKKSRKKNGKKASKSSVQHKVSKLKATLDAWVHSKMAYESSGANKEMNKNIDRMQDLLDDMLPKSSLASWHWDTDVQKKLLDMQEEFRYVYMAEQSKDLQKKVKGYISNDMLMDAQSWFGGLMNKDFDITLKTGKSSDQNDFPPNVNAKLTEFQGMFAKKNPTFVNTVSPGGLKIVQTKFNKQMHSNFNVEMKKRSK